MGFWTLAFRRNDCIYAGLVSCPAVGPDARQRNEATANRLQESVTSILFSWRITRAEEKGSGTGEGDHRVMIPTFTASFCVLLQVVSSCVLAAILGYPTVFLAICKVEALIRR